MVGVDEAMAVTAGTAVRPPKPKQPTKAEAERQRQLGEQLAGETVDRVLEEERVPRAELAKAARKVKAEAREAARKADMAAHIKAVVDKAPPLSPEQRDRIAALLRPPPKGP